MNLHHQTLYSKTVYSHLLLALLFFILVVLDKEFFNLKRISRILANHLNHRQYKHLQLWWHNCFFFFSNKTLLSNCILILYPEIFMLCKKTVYNGVSLEVYTHFDFQLIASSFKSMVLCWLINKHILKTIITKEIFTKKIP